MLQQILSDMYIDPELLEELPEEQKQFLFFKMREEQVRRWKVREKALSEIESTQPQESKSQKVQKNIGFLKGDDGNDWVWVMGEHKNDKSIEQILEEEAEEKAIKMAELEIQKEIALEKERKLLEEEKRLQEDKKKEEQLDTEELQDKEVTEKMEDQEMENRKIETECEKLMSEEEEQVLLKDKEKSKKDNKNDRIVVDDAKGNENIEIEVEDTSDKKAKIEETNLRRKVHSKKKMSESDNKMSQKEGLSVGQREGVKLRRTSRGSNDDDDRLRKLIMRRSREILFDFRSIRAKFEESAKKDGKELKRQWRAQEKKSKAMEEEIKQASLRVRQVHEKSIRSPVNAMMAIQLLQAQPSLSQEDEGLPAPVPRKSSKPRPLPTPPESDDGSPSASPRKPPVPPRPRITRRPASRQAAINWFERHQKPRSAVIIPETHAIAPWFQGLISRATAETVLEECATGTYLLRISERLFGYAVSVRGEHRCKHFLVEAMPQGGYRLFGLGQHQVHQSLHQFIKFHESNPLSAFGHELLGEPVNQTVIAKMEDSDSNISSVQTELFPEIPIEDFVTKF